MPTGTRKIAEILLVDTRYKADAYKFVLDAMEFTSSALPKRRHLSAVELLGGICQFARKKFGMFAGEVFTEWGVECALDIGNIVYNLIDAQLFFADERDKKSDFDIQFQLIMPESVMPESTQVEVPKID